MDQELTTPRRAGESIRATLPDWGDETVPLRTATGRVLAQAVAADRESPPFDRVCMDGLAVGAAPEAGQFLSSRAVLPAGSPRTALPPDGNLEVMTGGVLPDGAWGVLPYEDLEPCAGGFRFRPRKDGAPSRNVSPRGEDHTAGTLLLEAGTRLGAASLGILASVGCIAPRVRRRPRIAVVATGDELIDPDRTPLPHQLRRSNDAALCSLLEAWGFPVASVHALSDDLDTSRALLGQVLSEHDLVVTSGGVSMGRFDLVHGLLPELGIAKVFHGVAQKPGKPFWYGTGGGKAVFALPGNPVAALVCARRYLIPALDPRAQARPCPTPDSPEVTGKLVRFLPAHRTADGWSVVRSRGSGDFASLRGTEGFLEVAPAAWEQPSCVHLWEPSA